MTFNKRTLPIILTLFLFFGPELLAQYANFWDGIPKNIKEKNFYKRYEWFYRPRTDANGNVPMKHFSEQMKIEKTKIASQKTSKFSKVMGTSDLWTNIGPKAISMTGSGLTWGNVSGRARGLAVDPADPDVVYIGAAAGGIWKTNDGGGTWSDISGDFTLLTFGAIAIDPNNTNTIYAGTGEARYFFNQQTYEGDGLYKSVDGGSSWSDISDGSWTVTQFSDIAISPHNSNHILVALGSGNYNYGSYSNEGVWYSSNGGTSWSEVITAGDAFDVGFSPTNADSAYAVIGSENASSGFYVSTDGGASFPTQITTFDTFEADTSMGRAQFVQSPSRSSRFYMLIYDSDGQFPGSQATAAFKSTDGGGTWSHISSGDNIAGTYNGSTVSDQGSYDLCLDVSPTNPDSVFFGNVEMSSTSNGSTINFVRETGGTTAWDCPIHVDIHKIVYSPSHSKYIYAVSDGGVYRSTDGGANWSDLNNDITTIQFYNIASHPSNPNIIYGGAQDNGNFSTTDKGATNWVFEKTGDGMTCFVDRSGGGDTVLISTQYGRIYLSTDGGGSFSTVVSSDVFGTTAWTVPLWQDTGDPDIVYAAHTRVIKRSTSKGSGSWSTYSSTPASFTQNITDVIQSPATPNNMIAALSQYDYTPLIYKSGNRGVDWTGVTTEYNTGASSGAAPVLGAAAHPTDGDTFYLLRASYYSSGQVMVTTDGGDTWSETFSTLPDVPANDLFIDPDNTNHIYVANDFGVYWSSDGGTSFSKLNNGMPFLPVIDFDFYDDGSNRYLRAATHGRGVYELNIDSPLPVELSNFEVIAQEQSVLLNWETISETNNFGFEVQRSEGGNEFVKLGFVQGNGNTNKPQYYSYTDAELPLVNKVWYRLKQIDNDGQYKYSKTVSVDISTITGIEDESKNLTFDLAQNYPNPFNPATKISYTLPTTSMVNITIVNVLGQRVANLVAEEMPAGKHEALWNASEFSSGVYIYKIQVVPVNGDQAFSAVRKMILAK